MKKQIFLFSTESLRSNGGNLASLSAFLDQQKTDDKIELIGIASAHQNGNYTLAQDKKIKFYDIGYDEERSKYTDIFNNYPNAKFLFWDWHLILPSEILRAQPIFLFHPGPLEKFKDYSGPQAYTEAWKLATKTQKAMIALYDLQHNGKKLWSKNIKIRPNDRRKALNARMHYHMRSSIPDILDIIFTEPKDEEV
ncbi:MAG: hypothetical protein RBT30_03300 [Patescibacteria group bacterium]|jgi:hypothetical protein|nr:hypothetical protein [Patescibacteria group bacterium]